MYGDHTTLDVGEVYFTRTPCDPAANFVIPVSKRARVNCSSVNVRAFDVALSQQSCLEPRCACAAMYVYVRHAYRYAHVNFTCTRLKPKQMRTCEVREQVRESRGPWFVWCARVHKCILLQAQCPSLRTNPPIPQHDS
jgi:hypothetical protein